MASKVKISGIVSTLTPSRSSSSRVGLPIAATVAAIGKPTCEELDRLGIRVDTVPEKFTFEAMLQALAMREQEPLE